MRILLTYHFPLAQSPVGRLVWQWAQALQAAGDEVRLLVVDAEHRSGEAVAGDLPRVERIVCGGDPNADLPFMPPRFSTQENLDGSPVFSALGVGQLARYRDLLRRRLDQQILHFHPHVIHAQHIWVWGQLALETGVPYVLNAWEAELLDYPSDERYRLLADQAAENASRILVADQGVERRVESLFDLAADRTILMPEALRLDETNGTGEERLLAAGRQLHALYQTVLDERFG